MNIKIFIYTIVCTLFWGLSFAAMKLMLGYVEPMQVLVLRWTLAALIFGVMAAIGKIRINYRSKYFKFAILAGILEPCIYSIMEIYGIDRMSASLAAIFIATIPCLTLLFGAVLFRRKIKKLNAIGIFLAFAGVIISTIFAPGFSISSSAVGIVLMIAAVVSGALYSYASSFASEEIDAGTVTFVMAVSATMVFNIIALIQGYGAETYIAPFIDWHVTAGTLFLGVGCSILAYFSMNKLLGLIDTSVASSLTANLTTLIGVVGGIIIAGDQWGIYTIIGMLLTIAGVLLSSKTIE